MSGTQKERNTELGHQLAEARGALDAAEGSGDRHQLRRAKRQVDDLVAELVRQNMRLVYEYTKSFSDNGDDEEYELAGQLALLESVLTWDPAKGSVATWAMPRIRKAVLGAVGASEHRLKTHAFVARKKVQEAEAALRSELGRIPTDGELSGRSQVAESLVRSLRLNDAAGKTRSLNKVVGEDGTELGDVAGPTVTSAEDEALARSVEDRSHALLSERDPTELEDLFVHCNVWEVVSTLRYLGADGADREDFQELAMTFGCSRETLRKSFRAAAAQFS